MRSKLLLLISTAFLLTSCSWWGRSCDVFGGKRVCPSIYRPVCGADGKTHGNACVARYFKKTKVLYPGRCIKGLKKIPTCKRGSSLQQKKVPCKAKKGGCPTLVCVAPPTYIRGSYSDPTCKGSSCVVSTAPFKGAVFSCPRGHVPAYITLKGRRVQRCKRK